MSIVLGVAEGEVFVNDAEIQKSALQVQSFWQWLCFIIMTMNNIFIIIIQIFATLCSLLVLLSFCLTPYKKHLVLFSHI